MVPRGWYPAPRDAKIAYQLRLITPQHPCKSGRLPIIPCSFGNWPHFCTYCNILVRLIVTQLRPPFQLFGPVGVAIFPNFSILTDIPILARLTVLPLRRKYLILGLPTFPFVSGPPPPPAGIAKERLIANPPGTHASRPPAIGAYGPFHMIPC